MVHLVQRSHSIKDRIFRNVYSYSSAQQFIVWPLCLRDYGQKYHNVSRKASWTLCTEGTQVLF